MTTLATAKFVTLRLLPAAALTATFALLFMGCRGDESALPHATSGGPNVVEFSVNDLRLEGPDEIASGWTTIRLKNTSGMTHFAVLERLPDGMGLEEQQHEIAPVFQQGMDRINQGEAEAAIESFGALPEWRNDIIFMGGPGFVAPWHTSDVTVLLEPGTYLLECYVKTVGVFHSFNPNPDVFGMVHEITVTDAASGAQEPVADLDLTISSARGIEIEGDIGLGRHVVAVHFEDQMVYDHLFGHDVHLVRLAENTDLDVLATWMDWTQPTGLETPVPAEFLGGLHEMPAGQTGYFTIDLEPGSYAWIAEVPDPVGKKMLQTFSTSVRGGQ